MQDQELTQERLIQVINYCHETGILTWRDYPKKPARVIVGKEAGTLNNRGYRMVQIDGRFYTGHRLAWLYVYGEFPSSQIDHINRNRIDNRISNLRKCNNAENAQNRKKQRNNTSGVIGVHMSSSTGKWKAQIKINGKYKSLGLYKTKEDAASAYLAAKKSLHTFNPELK